MKLPKLNEGEIYIGAIGDQHGDAYHLILLPGDNNVASWSEQLEWAKSVGGDLPTRVEQAMLWANFRDQFQKDWYWSKEEYEFIPSYAWSQGFLSGTQGSSHEGVEHRARAVRRVRIGD